MTSKTELARVPEAIESPASMMLRAKQAGLSAEEMQDMLAVQKEWEANEARKAYHLAVKQFKAEEIRITKDKQVRFGDTEFSHASLANIIGTTVPYLSKHGLSHSWNTEQTDGTIKVTCTLTHELGHSESTSMQSAPDASGKKNPIQAIASAITYLERYTFMAITGLAAHDQPDIDDMPQEDELIDEEQLMNLEALITEVGADRAAFCKACKVESLDHLPKRRYQGAVQRLEMKREQTL